MLAELPRRFARSAAALVLCLLAAGSSLAAPKHAELKYRSGCEPSELRGRLARPDSVDVSRACGNLYAPWGYRGSKAGLLAMRNFGRRHAGGQVASTLAARLLSGNTIDSAFKAMSRSAPCDAETGIPVYLIRFYVGNRSTFALLNFARGHALFFDGEEPLGMVVMGASADSLWSTLAQLMIDDPLLRAERPPAEPDSIVSRWMRTDEPPVLIEHHEPTYPPEALAAKVEGTVLVWVKVGDDGAVHDAYAEGYDEATFAEFVPMLRDAALASVWQYRFKPARNNGKPVEIWIAIGVGFTLP